MLGRATLRERAMRGCDDGGKKKGKGGRESGKVGDRKRGREGERGGNWMIGREEGGRKEGRREERRRDTKDGKIPRFRSFPV